VDPLSATKVFGHEIIIRQDQIEVGKIISICRYIVQVYFKIHSLSTLKNTKKLAYNGVIEKQAAALTAY
jgi:CRISPR/Cas system-associated endonuclease Cas3-HD